MDCRKDLTAGGGFGLCCSSAGRSDDIIKHGDLRREDTADLRCVRREDGPDRTVRAGILAIQYKKPEHALNVCLVLMCVF